MVTSCVILNYNDTETTISLINHIENHKDLDYIVVVDNLSTDGSYDILKTLQSDRIHVLLSERNGGYGYGNNFGIRYSYTKLNAEYILIANPDVIFSNDCVRSLREALRENSECAVSSAVPLKPDGNQQKIIGWKLPAIKEEIVSASLFLSRLLGISVLYSEEYFLTRSKCYIDVVQGSMLMVNAQVMIEKGMYDEEFFLYFEEQVLAQKLKSSNYKSILLVDQKYIHNHSVTISKSYKSMVSRKKLLLESKLLYLKKYEGLGGIKYKLTKTFFYLTLGETWLISIINNFRKKGK
jgi:N-acetylglucosaminyl-diphospho-decaprenol L-rhamnosyltransferase